jgi:hypothetical protein
VSRLWGFVASPWLRGFTSGQERELQLPGHLTPGPAVAHDLVALLPFALRRHRLLRPLLTSRSVLHARRPFSRNARSPRIRTPPFAARPPDLRRLSLATEASRSLARSLRSASPPIWFLYVGQRLRSTLLPHGRSPFRSCASLRSRWPALGRTCTSKVAPVPGIQEKRPRVSSRPLSSARS